MKKGCRHQCLIYEGAPSRHLPPVAAVLRQNLSQNHRCLYLNSPPMVAGMRSRLAADGLDVLGEVEKGSLVFSSERDHLVDGVFDIDRMIEALERTVNQALEDGYAGLWASGDMSWEFGTDRDFMKLVTYEWRLEEFFHQQPALSGICQYHGGTLPAEAMRLGVLVHPSIFVNETLSVLNPHHIPRHAFSEHPELRPLLSRLGSQEAGA
jgi:MEDS: MEthanogen/methylotroph, DcmR Sensory domain